MRTVLGPGATDPASVLKKTHFPVIGRGVPEGSSYSGTVKLLDFWSLAINTFKIWITVSGNKVHVRYHLCIRHTKERAFVLHIIWEIAIAIFLFKKHVLRISYYMRHIIITN